MKVSDVPSELKKLNDLEKCLIALRLPFMKIIKLMTEKLCHKFSQKGTKVPLHCVPSDVQETVSKLPRPIDKSSMIRLQLKRKLNYKAVWEEQLINPSDVREALTALSKMHPDYENIEIEGPANLFRGMEGVGGKLFLTNKKVAFKSHKINI